MFAFNSGQEVHTLVQARDYWEYSDKGRRIIAFLSSLDKITPSPDRVKKIGPDDFDSITLLVINPSHNPRDRFTDEGNEHLISIDVAGLDKSRSLGYPLPEGFIVSQCLNHIFRRNMKKASFAHALKGLDWIRRFEMTRRDSLRKAAERLNITKDNWHRVLQDTPECYAWIRNMETLERKVSRYYASIYVDLRVWTMVKELQSIPFYKPHLLASLNTLFPPCRSNLDNDKIDRDSMFRFRAHFYDFILRIPSEGQEILDAWVTRFVRTRTLFRDGSMPRNGSCHNWPTTRHNLLRFFEIATEMIKKSELVYDVAYFQRSTPFAGLAEDISTMWMDILAEDTDSDDDDDDDEYYEDAPIAFYSGNPNIDAPYQRVIAKYQATMWSDGILADQRAVAERPATAQSDRSLSGSSMPLNNVSKISESTMSPPSSSKDTPTPTQPIDDTTSSETSLRADNTIPLQTSSPAVTQPIDDTTNFEAPLPVDNTIPLQTSSPEEFTPDTRTGNHQKLSIFDRLTASRSRTTILGSKKSLLELRGSDARINTSESPLGLKIERLPGQSTKLASLPSNTIAEYAAMFQNINDLKDTTRQLQKSDSCYSLKAPPKPLNKSLQNSRSNDNLETPTKSAKTVDCPSDEGQSLCVVETSAMLEVEAPGVAEKNEKASTLEPPVVHLAAGESEDATGGGLNVNVEDITEVASGVQAVRDNSTVYRIIAKHNDTTAGEDIPMDHTPWNQSDGKSRPSDPPEIFYPDRAKDPQSVLWTGAAPVDVLCHLPSNHFVLPPLYHKFGEHPLRKAMLKTMATPIPVIPKKKQIAPPQTPVNSTLRMFSAANRRPFSRNVSRTGSSTPSPLIEQGSSGSTVEAVKTVNADNNGAPAHSTIGGSSTLASRVPVGAVPFSKRKAVSEAVPSTDHKVPRRVLVNPTIMIEHCPGEVKQVIADVPRPRKGDPDPEPPCVSEAKGSRSSIKPVKTYQPAKPSPLLVSTPQTIPDQLHVQKSRKQTQLGTPPIKAELPGILKTKTSRTNLFTGYRDRHSSRLSSAPFLSSDRPASRAGTEQPTKPSTPLMNDNLEFLKSPYQPETPSISALPGLLKKKSSFSSLFQLRKKSSSGSIASMATSEGNSSQSSIGLGINMGSDAPAKTSTETFPRLSQGSRPVSPYEEVSYWSPDSSDEDKNASRLSRFTSFSRNALSTTFRPRDNLMATLGHESLHELHEKEVDHFVKLQKKASPPNLTTRFATRPGTPTSRPGTSNSTSTQRFVSTGNGFEAVTLSPLPPPRQVRKARSLATLPYANSASSTSLNSSSSLDTVTLEPSKSKEDPIISKTKPRNKPRRSNRLDRNTVAEDFYMLDHADPYKQSIDTQRKEYTRRWYIENAVAEREGRHPPEGSPFRDFPVAKKGGLAGVKGLFGGRNEEGEEKFPWPQGEKIVLMKPWRKRRTSLFLEEELPVVPEPEPEPEVPRGKSNFREVLDLLEERKLEAEGLVVRKDSKVEEPIRARMLLD